MIAVARALGLFAIGVALSILTYLIIKMIMCKRKNGDTSDVSENKSTESTTKDGNDDIVQPSLEPVVVASVVETTSEVSIKSEVIDTSDVDTQEDLKKRTQDKISVEIAEVLDTNNQMAAASMVLDVPVNEPVLNGFSGFADVHELTSKDLVKSDKISPLERDILFIAHESYTYKEAVEYMDNRYPRRKNKRVADLVISSFTDENEADALFTNDGGLIDIISLSTPNTRCITSVDDLINQLNVKIVDRGPSSLKIMGSDEVFDLYINVHPRIVNYTYYFDNKLTKRTRGAGNEIN